MNPKQDGYIRKEASEITQIRARTIQYYTDRGFVNPDVFAAKGRGTTRRYSLKNLVELAIVKELSAHGYTLERIEKIMGDLRESRERLDSYWDKANDKPTETDLLLILLNPGSKDVEVWLRTKEDVYLHQLIPRGGFRNFSIIGLKGVIERILEAVDGT